MICPFCGAELPDGASFCDMCGNVMELPPDPNAQPEQVPPPELHGQPGQVPPPETYVQSGQAPPPEPYSQPGSTPPPMGNPYGQSPYAPGYGAQTAPKKSPLIPILIASGAVLLVGVVVLLIIILGKGGDGDGDAASGSAVTQATAAPEVTAEPDLEVTPEPTEEPTPEPTEEPTPEPEATPDPAQKIKEYTTDVRPNVGDFYWFDELYGSNDVSGAIEAFFSQDGATQIQDLSALEGGWKAEMRGDPDSYHDESTYRYLNVIIEPRTEEKAKVTLDWFQMIDGGTGESFPEEDYDSTAECKWYTGKGFLSDGQLDLVKFIEYNDKQYAYGKYHWESGEVDLIVLVRP